MSGSVLDAIAHPASVNPLAAYAQALQVNQGLNANRLFQSQQAAGQAFQDSIGPDGTPDQNRLLLNLKNDPTAALSAQPSAQAGQSLASDQYAQQMKRMTYGAAGFSQILVDHDGTAPYEAVKQYYDRSVEDGHMTAADEARVMSGFGADPVANASVGRQRMMQNIAAQEALSRANGRPTTVDDGQVIRGGMVNSQSGALTVPGAPPVIGGQGVQKQTGPETNAAQTETYVEDPAAPGTYRKVLTPRSAMPGASGIAGEASPLGTGRQPPPGLLNPDRQQGTSATPTGGAPLAAPPVGSNEAAGADVAKFKQDQFALPTGQRNVQTLQKAQVALEASNTGRNSEGVQNMLATAQTLGIPLPAGISEDVKNYDLAHKLLTDYARSSGAAAHSDLQLQTAEGANASTGISNQAALDVVHLNIGRERQAIAQNMEAPQTGVGYGAHTSKFSNETDPRGFAIDAYKPAELQKMIAGMKAPDVAKFYKSVGIAQRLKLINPAAP